MPRLFHRCQDQLQCMYFVLYNWYKYIVFFAYLIKMIYLCITFKSCHQCNLATIGNYDNSNDCIDSFRNLTKSRMSNCDFQSSSVENDSSSVENRNCGVIALKRRGDHIVESYIEVANDVKDLSNCPRSPDGYCNANRAFNSTI